MSDFDDKTWQDLPLTPNTGETVDDWFARIATWAAANPSLSTPLNAAALNDFEARIAAAIPTVVTALPGSPSAGQEVYYQAGTGDTARLWHLRYDSSITDAYKWRVIGATSLYDEVTATETTTSTTYTNLTTTGPAITIPLAGIYDVAIGGRLSNATAGQASAMSYGNGATAAVDADWIVANSAQNNTPARKRQKTLTAAALTAKYRATGGTASFSERWIEARPVRVG